MNAKAWNTLLAASLSLFVLSACGGSKGSPAPAASTQAANAAAPAGSSLLPNISLTPSEDQAGRLVFPKTLAAGHQAWNAGNVRVKFLRAADGVKREGWTADCTAPAPIDLNGNYPNVFFSMPTIDCGGRATHELARLGALTHGLNYRAVPVPAAGDADQFRLYLASSDTGGGLRWSSQQSLNSLAKDRIVYLDLQGDEQRDLAYPENRHHFVQITLEPGEDAQSAKLTAEYIYDGDAQAEHEELKVTADLSR